MDIVLIGVVLGTILFWAGLAMFYMGVKKDRKKSKK